MTEENSTTEVTEPAKEPEIKHEEEESTEQEHPPVKMEVEEKGESKGSEESSKNNPAQTPDASTKKHEPGQKAPEEDEVKHHKHRRSSDVKGEGDEEPESSERSKKESTKGIKVGDRMMCLWKKTGEKRAVEIVKIRESAALHEKEYYIHWVKCKIIKNNRRDIRVHLRDMNDFHFYFYFYCS